MKSKNIYEIKSKNLYGIKSLKKMHKQKKLFDITDVKKYYGMKKVKICVAEEIKFYTTSLKQVEIYTPELTLQVCNIYLLL